MTKISCSSHWILFLSLCFFTMLSISETTAQVSQQIEYICLMKCEDKVYHDQGTCPVCGMTLVKKSTFKRLEESAGYLCRPCGHNCLETIFEEPGACGECGMKLASIEKVLTNLRDHAAAQAGGSAGRKVERKSVAILLFNGVQIIDYTGPWEIFGQARFDVFTVAIDAERITTAFGMKVTPDYTLTDHPKPDIILVPGGGVLDTQNDPGVKKWLNEKAEEAEIVLSVCNGAYILAKAGLLNGLKATTTRALVDGLANAAPNITVVRDTRFVDNGKVITSGGLSAGMDAALHVVSRIHGEERAKRIAYGIEYEWRPHGLVAKSRD